MVALQSLALCLSLTGAGQIVLLDFYSNNCPPCRQMAPLIDQMISAGYPVKKINVEEQPMVAQQYGVTSWPTFIVMGPSGEVGRMVGARRDCSELIAMFQRAGFRPGAPAVAQATPQAPALPQTPPTPRWDWSNNSQSAPPARVASQREERSDLSKTSASQSVIERAMAASVRLKIEDGGQSFSYGSGTIIDMQGEEALVLTCGHVFHDSQGKGRVTVDLFDKNGGHTSVPGQVIHFDEKRDVGLVAIRPGYRIEPMKVGGQGCKAERGMRVFSIGCDRGANPSVRESRVSNINRYLGPANIEVEGAPVDGRSGGGLFMTDGTIIGVCNAADPGDDEGIFAALETVHAELTAANLSFIYNGGVGREIPGSAVAANPAPRSSSPNVSTPRLDDAFPRDARPNASAPPLSAPLLADDDTEVILIVRSRSQPDRKAETMVISRPTQELLRSIATQRQLQNAPQNTSMQVTSPMTAASPAAPRHR